MYFYGAANIVLFSLSILSKDDKYFCAHGALRTRLNEHISNRSVDSRRNSVRTH